jgi:hypothetical protein
VADIHINEVHTELQIAEGVGTLGPAEVQKLVMLVIAQLKSQQHLDELRKRDNRLQNGAYVADVSK